jgi:hypothetical protein
VSGQRRNPKIKDPGCDTVRPDHDCRTPQGGGDRWDNGAVMIKIGKMKKLGGKPVSSVTSLTMILT